MWIILFVSKLVQEYSYKGTKAATATAGIIAEKSICAADWLLAIIIIPTRNPYQPTQTAPFSNSVTRLLPSLGPKFWPIVIPKRNQKAKRSIAGPMSPAALNAPTTTITINLCPTCLIVSSHFSVLNIWSSVIEEKT